MNERLVVLSIATPAVSTAPANSLVTIPDLTISSRYFGPPAIYRRTRICCAADREPNGIRSPFEQFAYLVGNFNREVMIHSLTDLYNLVSDLKYQIPL